MPNLDFSKSNTLYATHGIHAFAAKGPPQLVDYGIRYYSKRGDTILDPMMGSGTTLAEAILKGRNSIGFDIDPIAYLIAKVKTNPIEISLLDNAYNYIFNMSQMDIQSLKGNKISPHLEQRTSSKYFLNSAYWFLPDVAQALSILSFHIYSADLMPCVKDFFWVVFSSLVLSKSSVANARDITHSRHHYKKHDETPDVLGKFRSNYRRMRRMMSEFYELCKKYPYTKASALQGDARNLPVEDSSIDLVFTSPPYATALDYTRAHFLVIPWMEKKFNTSFEKYKEKGVSYIGSQRGKLPTEFSINPVLMNLGLTSQVLKSLSRQSEKHAKLVQRYFVDMYQVFSEISRVLKPGKKAIIVVCPSNIRKVQVPTHEVFVEFGKSNGLTIKHQHIRTIDKQKRLMPYIKKSFGPRMSTEYVLVFERG